jgi:hypothetical protein
METSTEEAAEEAEDSISKDSAGCSSAPQAQANSKRKAVKSRQIRLGYANSRAIIISSQSGGRKTAQKIFISIPYFRPKKQLAKTQKMSKRFWSFRQKNIPAILGGILTFEEKDDRISFAAPVVEWQTR